MLVIPAIDIRNGQFVRLTQGDFDQQTVYGSDPVAMAKQWEAEGARMLHIVDLDGAKDGTSKNLPVILKIAQTLSIPIEVGGGIRTLEAVDALLSGGVSRVVLGTVALEDPDLLGKMLQTYAPKLAVALDTRKGKLVSRGWQKDLDDGLVETALKLEDLGVARFIYTDVVKDGTLTEPNYQEIEELVKRLKVPLIVGGGVSSTAAIKSLRAMNVEGVIIGKAFYEGKLDLREANDVS